jgi:hypothetical protein
MRHRKIRAEEIIDTPDDMLIVNFPRQRYGLTRGQLRELKKRAVIEKEKEYIERIQELERELEAIKKIKSTPQSAKIRFRERKSKLSAVAFIVASDWHIDEIVKPESVSRLNEFNLKIAEKRINNFFTNAVKLLKINNQDVVIEKVVFALLGDFISGNIHEELLENTSLRPIEAILWVQDRLIEGIRYFLNNTGFDFIIVCHQGNHPRITKQVHISTESGNSLEYFMYHNLKNVFKNEKRLKWIIADGYHTYLELFGKTVRFHHGHSIKFNKNVGGIFPTVYKAIMQWNKAKKADYDIMGHFHQSRNGGNFICNGSLIGYNAFSVFITAEYEKPKQKFFMLASNGEIIGEFPIFLE